MKKLNKMSSQRSPYLLRTRNSPDTMAEPYEFTLGSVSQVNFALTPGRAYSSNTLDLTSKIVITVFNGAITKLTVSFDKNSQDIFIFQSQLKKRATNTGWNIEAGDIIMIPDFNRDETIRTFSWNVDVLLKKTLRILLTI